MQQRDARGDEERAQDDRSGHAPEQGGVLAARRDAKALEENQEDKEIVDAERGFDGVAGDEFEGGLMAFGDGDPGGEGGCGGDEKSGPEPGDGLGAASFRSAAGEKRNRPPAAPLPPHETRATMSMKRQQSEKQGTGNREQGIVGL